MKVSRFNKTRLRNEEWFEFFTIYKKYVELYDSEKIGIKELFKDFLALYKIADLLIQSLKKSYYTKLIATANTDRKNGFRRLLEIAKGFQGDPDAGKKDAAMHLYNLLQGYQKNVLRGSYAEASASVYNLLQDLGEDRYVENTELLGLRPWVKVVENAQKAFLKLWDQRTQEDIIKPNESLTSIRQQVDVLYSSMITVIDSILITAGLGGDVAVEPESLDLADHDGSQKFDPTLFGNITYNFVIAWNSTVKKYRTLSSQHAARNSKDKEAAEE
ncbi:MAG: DUF6261 family protein [Tannerellaceae bacterium]|jgi:hypothetical protein|nr:DUF6261 family protein [Tannerellaceae bacterium]